MNLEQLAESNAYQAWIYSQLEPDDMLFVGRKPPHETKTWMLRGVDRPEPTEQEIEKMEDEYLKKFGL